MQFMQKNLVKDTDNIMSAYICFHLTFSHKCPLNLLIDNDFVILDILLTQKSIFYIFYIGLIKNKEYKEFL